MFDPDLVGRDMARIFGGIAGRGDAAAPSVARAMPPQALVPPAASPKVRRRGGRGLVLVALLLLLFLMLPLAVVVRSYRGSSSRPIAGKVPETATAMLGRIAPRDLPAFSGTAPQGPPAGSAAQDGATSPARRGAVARHAYRRPPRSVIADVPGQATLEQQIADDAVLTKRLNETAMARLKPTLGYSPTVIDQVAPR